MAHNFRYLYRFIVIFILLVAILPAKLSSYAAQTLQTSTPDLNAMLQGDLHAFHLVAQGQAWLQLKNSLYWTNDNGVSWQDITPPLSGSDSVQAVTFLDAQHGFALLVGQDDAGSPSYSLAQTADGGFTWKVNILPLFEPDDSGAKPEAVYLQFLDELTGWIMVKQVSSAAFSVGTLFATTDGGQTWSRKNTPIGAPVYFISADTGWIAGGPAGDQFYRTVDGGQTWISQAFTAPEGTAYLYQLPEFFDEQNGLLPVDVNSPSGSRIDFYRTSDGGQTWTLETSANVTQPLFPDVKPPLSILGPDDWMLVDPQQQAIISSQGGSQPSIESIGSALPPGIVALDMVTASDGWAQTVSNDCQPAPDDAHICQSSTVLLSTGDGGVTWTRLGPTGGQIQSLPTNILVVAGQGFDSCTTPTPSQMQDWMDHSPYHFWNLYIGGADLYPGCGGTSLNATYLSYLSQQGWKFIVIWVGPQASCFAYGGAKMSSDPTTAYNQGKNEADLAVARATNLQLTLPGGTGAMIYYDLEAYNVYDTTCQAAAEAFVSGWTAEIQARGNLAGVYGTRLSVPHFATISSVPNGVWIAWYNYSSFTNDATVWGITGVSDSLWSNHQRILQYAGGHNETWGSTTINIDSDVADGLMVDLGGTPVAAITSPANNAWLGPSQTVPVNVSVLDPSFGINRVVFQWHDANWATSNWQTLGTDTNGSDGWSIPFSTAGLCNQRGIAIYATVYNAAGDHHGYGVWNLGVDCNAPTASVTTSTWYSNSPFRDFRVRWSGSDLETSVASYDVQYKDGVSGTWTNLVSSSTTTSYDFFPGVWNHTYYFRIRARDVFGNTSAWTTNNVYFTVPSANDPISADISEIDNTPATAKVVLLDSPPVAHNVNVEGDVDWIKFTVPGFTSVRITTANIGGYGDTVVYLYGPDGTTLLASNDDYPGLNMGSRIDWAFSRGGTYYAKITHFDPYASGNKTQYTVSIATTKSYWMMLPIVGK